MALAAARTAAFARVAVAMRESHAPVAQRRPIRVTQAFAGMSALEFAVARLARYGRPAWEATFAAGEIRRANGAVVDQDALVEAGEHLYYHGVAQAEPPVAADVMVIHEDEALVVVSKPAPLPVHPSGHYAQHTLLALLRQVYGEEAPHPAHRLDANTTGVLVCTKGHAAAGFVQEQFARREVVKTYVARLHGHPTWSARHTDAPIARSADVGGARHTAPDGDPAVTDWQVLARDADGTTLVAAMPLTGRSHQLRLHAQTMGHAIVGDPLYLPTGRRGTRATLHPSDPPMCLHAARIALRHPLTHERVEYVAPCPAWAGGLVPPGHLMIATDTPTHESERS
jgi:UPF0176 protein